GRKAAAGVFLGHSKSSFLPDFEVDIIAVTHSKLVVQGVGLRSVFGPFLMRGIREKVIIKPGLTGEKVKGRGCGQVRLPAKILLLGAVSLLVFLVFSSVSFGAAPSPVSDPVNVNVNVGDFIAIDNPSNLQLPDIIGDNTSVGGNVTWNVKTNNATGYNLQIASAQP
ncbi:MAG: hypothetical protein ACYDGX_09540, partial [Thermoleophilia bacterium]